MAACAATALISVTATAGAASHYLITSTRQIKPSVRSALKGERGPRGYAGFNGTNGLAGTPGPAGPTGPAGPSAVSRITHVSSTVALAPDQVQLVTVTCPAGQSVVSGGFGVVGTAFISDGIGSTWTVGVDTYGNSSTYDQHAYASCAATGQAVAARSGSKTTSERYARLVAERRKVHD